MRTHFLQTLTTKHLRRTFVVALGMLMFGSISTAEAAGGKGKHKGKAAPAVTFEEPGAPTPAPDGSSPMADLKKSHAKLQKLITKKSPGWSPEAAARNKQVKQLVGGFLDFKELAKRSLARNWEPLTPQNKSEFVDTLRGLVERSYVNSMHGEANYTLEWQKEDLKPETAKVLAELHTTRKGKKMDVSLEYKLVHKSDGWVVWDVVTDEQSLVETYRAEFAKIIKKESFDALLDRMKKKLSDSGKGKKK